ncbi:MAG TPA: hypothetical protein VNT79_05540, partial [Phycisphaerae bacterium]|nr:hypothetical protein [Phycisphaerae bacterium]
MIWINRRALAALFVVASIACIDSNAVHADETVGRLLSAMPADAFLVVYVENPRQVLPPSLLEPIFKSISKNEAGAREMLDALREIPGGFAMGIVPPPKFDWSHNTEILVAMALDRPDATFADWFEKRMFPAITASWNNDDLKLLKREGGLAIGRKQGDRTPNDFSFAWKDGLAFGSNKTNRVLAWHRGEYPKKSFLTLPGLRRSLRSMPKDSGVRVLINPKEIRRAFPNPMPQSWDEMMMKLLAPDDIEFVAADLGWDRNCVRLTATASLAEECKGVAHVLARPSTDPQCLGVFPPDFCMVGRVAFPTAQSAADGLYALTDLIDPTISQEYHEDMSAFKSNYGVNWDAGFLAQLVHEVAFGLRVDFTRKSPIGWAAVAPLADRAIFDAELNRLIAAFELPVDKSEKDGLPIHTNREGAPFSFAVVRDFLVVADAPETINDVAKNLDRKQAEPAGPRLRRFSKRLASPNQLAAMIDLQMLSEKAPFIPFAAGAKFGPLISRGNFGMALSGKDRTATFEIVWDPGRPDSKEGGEVADHESLAALTELVAETLLKAREEAKRTIAMAQMRNIAM